MAVEGATVMTRGPIPLLRPFQPSRSRMMRSASLIPLAFRILSSVDDPRVWSRVCGQVSTEITDEPCGERQS